ncbi:MAG: hypothetical protein ACR2QK_05100 [Acidimicrobiales bacterium]
MGFIVRARRSGFAITEPRPDTDRMDYRMAHFLAAGVFWLVLWNVSVLVGIAIGNVIPASWSLDFAVPLLFLGLLINALRDRPGLVAAAVSGVLAVLGRDLQPAGLGLLGGVLPPVLGDGGLSGVARPDANVVAAVLAAVVAYRTKNIAWVLIVGMVALWSLRWLGL